MSTAADRGVSTARVTTDRPGRYGKQLVAHLTRRNPGAWDEQTETGWIAFAAGRAELSTDTGALSLRVESGHADLAYLEDVVGRHLVRFGARDELVVRWTRMDGSVGTEQRNAGEG